MIPNCTGPWSELCGLSSWLYFGIAALILAACVVLMFIGTEKPVFSDETPRTPNIVFVLADDLGWTGLGCFGSDFYETPNIDRLAAQGMRFDKAYANMMVCAPSRASLLSGQYVGRHRVLSVSHYQTNKDTRPPFLFFC